MAAEIENPFGWDTNDHDLSRFCKTLYEETEMIKKIE
jgi:predicted membrane chloride channel (bestrophin family)